MLIEPFYTGAFKDRIWQVDNIIWNRPYWIFLIYKLGIDQWKVTQCQNAWQLPLQLFFTPFDAANPCQYIETLTGRHFTTRLMPSTSYLLQYIHTRRLRYSRNANHFKWRLIPGWLWDLNGVRNTRVYVRAYKHLSFSSSRRINEEWRRNARAFSNNFEPATANSTVRVSRRRLLGAAAGKWLAQYGIGDLRALPYTQVNAKRGI